MSYELNIQHQILSTIKEDRLKEILSNREKVLNTKEFDRWQRYSKLTSIKAEIRKKELEILELKEKAYKLIEVNKKHAINIKNQQN